MAPGFSDTLGTLAAAIASNTAIVNAYLQQNGYAEPSFSVDTLAVFPSEAPAAVHLARSNLVAAARDMSFLAAWPREAVRDVAFTAHSDMSTLRWLFHHSIAKYVPLEGQISFSDLAKIANVDESRLTRIMRYAMTNKFFAEPSPGVVMHTSMSALLSTSEAVQGVVGHQTETVFPAAAKVVEANEEYGDSDASNHTGFNVAFGTHDGMFEWLPKHPERARWFASSMMASHNLGPTTFEGITHAFDWNSLGHGVVVDVGGGLGHVSIEVAKNFPLHCIVQDLQSTIQSATAPDGLKGRIDFMEHDFFNPNPNPIPQAAVYLLRMILHDWPDSDAVRILRPIALAMGPESRIIIAETVLESSDELHGTDERRARALDMIMMTLLNGRERTREQLESLIRQADARLNIINVVKVPGSPISHFELVKENPREDAG